MVWVSPYHSATETSYQLDVLVPSQTIAGITIFPLDTFHSIGLGSVEIVLGRNVFRCKVLWVSDAYHLEHTSVLSQDVVTRESEDFTLIDLPTRL